MQPLRLIGYWSTPSFEIWLELDLDTLLAEGHTVDELRRHWELDPERQWPDVAEFVDPTWDPRERRMVADYLARGQRTPWMYMGLSTCRFCGASNGSLEFTDGVYLWPEGLSH